MTKALAAAERLLETIGPEKTSIPEIAKVSGVPRASIYQFFPDKYALFAHLAKLHIGRVEQAIVRINDIKQGLDWRTMLRLLVEAAASYYNNNPVASILLLDGAFSRSDHEAHVAKNQSLGVQFRATLARTQSPLRLPTEPDAAVLAIEIAFACMKHGYHQEGRISKSACNEAIRAVTAYLANWE
jgi:AcrR family transcriptional regulator